MEIDGNPNRVRILNILRASKFEMVMSQLEKELELDWKEIAHHLGILEREKLIKSRYGQTTSGGYTHFYSANP